MPAGRPSLYKPEYAEQAAKLCALGATDADLADFFEVTIRTIENWRSQNEDFFRSIKEAKEAANDRVERSLYQKAIGYSHDAVKIFQHQGEVIEAPYREHYPPDSTAAIFWLKNRRKDDWRDKQEHEHSGKIEKDVSPGTDALAAAVATLIANGQKSGD